MRIEKDVSGIVSGTIADTNLNIWLSVITMLTRRPRIPSTDSSSVSLTAIETPLLSRMLLMACCCGNISRPLGAALSIGMTRTAISPCVISPERRLLSSSEEERARPIAFFSSSTPSPVTELTKKTDDSPALSFNELRRESLSRITSLCVTAKKDGMPFCPSPATSSA